MQPFSFKQTPGAKWLFAAVLPLLLALPMARGADVAAAWNGSTGNWTEASRWSTSPAFPNNTASIFYDATISGGVVTLDQNIAINQLVLSGGTLGGSSALALAEGIAWSGGSMAFTGAGRLLLGAGSTSSVTGAPIFTSGRVVGGGEANLSISAGATLTALNDASFFADSVSPAWSLNNAGTFIARGTSGSGFVSMDAAFHSTGAVRVEIAGASAQTLSLAGGGTLGGTVVLEAGAAIELGGTTTLQSGAAFSGEGVAVIAGEVIVAGSLSAENVLVAVGELKAGSSLVSVSGSLAQTGGIVRLGGGTLRVADGLGTFVMDDGLLTGTGTLDAGLLAQGDVAPGTALGTLGVSGSATFGEDARLVLELGGTTSGLFDVLSVAGAAELGGLLNVRLANGFTPSGTDSFTILTAGLGVSEFFANAAFDGARFDTADGLGSFVVDYTASSVVLTSYIPEPSVTALLGLCGALLASSRRRTTPSRV